MFNARLFAITGFADGIADELALREAEFELKDESFASEIERLTCYIARVSNPNNQANPNIQGLLNTCIKKGHWSVFEHGYMTFELTTSIAVTKQILRHRSMTFQEMSQRYANVSKAKDGKMFMPINFRRQDTKNRQNSIDDLDETTKLRLRVKAEHLLASVQDFYEQMLDEGIAKEVARMILPQCTESTLYMTGNIRSIIHWIELRTDPSTQLEHREVALACQDIFIKTCPIISKAKGWFWTQQEWRDMQHGPNGYTHREQPEYTIR